MVTTDHAQLFTIEGIVAALIMVSTAYIVITSTTLYTPVDVQVSDMQMEQLANDILASMDTRDQIDYSVNNLYDASYTPLQKFIHESINGNDANASFASNFTAMSQFSVQDSKPGPIQYKVCYSDKGNTCKTITASAETTGRERMVRATRFVNIRVPGDQYEPVLVELYLWRA